MNLNKSVVRKKVLVCVGTRPNLIKITQLAKAFEPYEKIEYLVLHTGQHYDEKMNSVFFRELGIQEPKIQFTLSGKSQIEIVAEIMQKFEIACNEIQPDLVMVPGDVNSSFACAFVANRLGIPVAHIESGLRSFDPSMPEEINRILIDDLSVIHFVTEISGEKHLKQLGFTHSIKNVGNSMIDSLVAYQGLIDQSSILSDTKLEKDNYAIVTFHRPSNVDSAKELKQLLSMLSLVSKKIPVVFPVHPRTIKNIHEFGLSSEFNDIQNLIQLPPQGYIDFLSLVKNAKLVITDSGGLQEETTFLKVPCLTIRPNTERPITCDEGTNTLLPFDMNKISDCINQIMDGTYKKGEIPRFWDGHTSERIAHEVSLFFEENANKKTV